MIESRQLEPGDVVMVGTGRRFVLCRTRNSGPWEDLGQIFHVTYLLLNDLGAGEIVTWPHTPTAWVEIEREP